MRIPVVLEVGEAEVDLELQLPDDLSAVTVAEVVEAALGGPGPADSMLLVDGRLVESERSVDASGLVAGSVLSWAPTSIRPNATTATATTVAVVGGLDAGETFDVVAGSLVIGRSPHATVCLADRGLSGRHARVDVVDAERAVITDLHSHGGVSVNGLRLDGPARVTPADEVTLGRSRLRIGGRPDRSAGGRPLARTGAGQLLVHRHRRQAVAGAAGDGAGLGRLEPPVVMGAASGMPRPPWAAIIAPAVLGVVLAMVFGPTMAIFALLGPVMAVVSWLDERRRVRRDQRQRDQDHQAATAAFASAVQTAAAHARAEAVARHPDPSEVVRRAVGRDWRVWERHPGDNDFLEVAVGTGDTPWLDAPRSTGADDVALTGVLADTLAAVPIALDLQAARAVGIAGPRDEVDALVRWIVLQIAVHHSPCEVGITVMKTDRAPADRWDWTKWLPHGIRADTDGAMPDHEVAIVDSRGGSADAVALTSRVLRGRPGAVVVVVADRTADLPSVCRATVELHGSGMAMVAAGPTHRTAMADGVTLAAARRAARALAPLVDAEAGGSSTRAAGLPATVTINDVLGEPVTAQSVRQRWRRAGPVPRLAAPVGVTADGPLVVDLDRDGPHGVLAGTTGSGKSEFLRSLVAGLAANVRPEHLSFVLVDFKGGSAFGPLARLPHVVGLVTDLDDHLAARALRSLEAELRRRERLLRTVGVEDLRSYLESAHAAIEPLPALLVVVDEFATLAADLPGFVDSLVDVAQRGRSLGIHLLLSTQRPAGAMNANLRANANLRVALRLQDDADSTDIIGAPVAAALSRTTPGRGFVRTGQGEMVMFQAATTTVQQPRDGGSAGNGCVTARPFVRMTQSGTPSPYEGDGAGAHSPRLDLLGPLVDAIAAAAADEGVKRPRAPWLEPLPEHIDLADLPAAAEGDVPLGLADDPDNQCQYVYGWRPGSGNVALIGEPASSGDALTTLAFSAAGALAIDRLYIYALDFGPGRLAAVADLPHTGALIGAAERDRQERLIRMLSEEVERRRASRAVDAPTVLLLIDNYAGFHAAYDDLAGLPWREALVRIFADGPALGIIAAVAVDRPSGLPPSAAAAFSERLVFRLTDPLDGHLVGVAPRLVAGLPAGRAVHVASGLEVQWATAVKARGAAPRGAGEATRVAPPVEAVPALVEASALPAPVLDGSDWMVPVGLGDDLAPAVLPVVPSEPVLVAGAGRSGRSTALTLIAETAGRTRPDVAIHAIALRPSPLRLLEGIDCATTRTEVAAVLEAASADDGRVHLLLVDDAETVEDPTGVLQRLADAGSTLCLVAAGRSDLLRTRFGHWTSAVRRSGVGIVLRPRPEVDCDLWQVPLPRASMPFGPGRGYVVQHGEVALVQLALPRSSVAMTRPLGQASVVSLQ